MRLVILSIALASLGTVACTKAPVIDKTALADRAVENQPHSFPIKATNKPTEYNAQLPSGLGLSIDKRLGVISGTPVLVGQHLIPITVQNSAGEDNAILSLVVEPAPHEVITEKELLILHPDIIQDAKLVGLGGPWHFKTLLKQIAGKNTDLDTFINDWIKEWDLPATIGQSKVPARPGTAAVLRKAINEDRIKLLAIVNRIDLTRFTGDPANLDPSRLGEGRFVFEVVSEPSGPFTIILEYGLPAPTGNIKEELHNWALRWHDLGRTIFGDKDHFPENYRTELVKLTNDFTSTGQLNQLRTDERITNWDLREFKYQADIQRLKLAPLAQTPDQQRFSNTPQLSEWVRDNTAAILEGEHEIPDEFIGGSTDSLRSWIIPAPADPHAAFIVAFNTCGDCHLTLTQTNFQHIHGFQSGSAASISKFLSGVIPLKFSLPKSSITEHDEMAERAALLLTFVSPSNQKISHEKLTAMLVQRAKREH